MSPELRAAIESARSREAQRWHSFETVQQLLYNVIRELPEEMSVREIREQLE